MDRDRAERNLVFWRRLVGLDPDFPALHPLGEHDLSTLTVVDEKQADLLQASLAGEQLTQVVVDAGWGATTLFRYTVKEARDHVMEGLVLPIAIDLERLFLQEDLLPDSLALEIKRQIIGLLVDNPWEAALNRDYYFECINYDSSTSLAVYKARMLQFLFDRLPSERALVGQFPWLRDDLSAQLHYLLTNLRIQTAIFVHLPTSIDSQRIRDLISAIKWIASDTGPIEYAAWREVYFCTPRQRPEIGRDWQRAFSVLRYPRYTAAQVYLMMIRRYQPLLRGLSGRRNLGLSEVFSEAFVYRAWQDAETLKDLTDRVRQAMLERLDCPETAVPFRLEPHVNAINRSDAGPPNGGQEPSASSHADAHRFEETDVQGESDGRKGRRFVRRGSERTEE